MLNPCEASLQLDDSAGIRALDLSAAGEEEEEEEKEDEDADDGDVNADNDGKRSDEEDKLWSLR